MTTVRLSALIAVLLFFTHAFGQAKPVTVVEAGSLTPLPKVWVFDEAETILLQTDSSGYFDYARFSDKHHIVFFHPDYVRRVLTRRQVEQENFTVSLERVRFTSQEVVVHGHRFGGERKDVPQVVTTVTPRQIRFGNPPTTADALAQNGNVFVQKSQQGGGSPMIRGFAANSVLMVIDGVRMNNAIYRGGNLQNSISVDANSLGSAEVLFGPGSVQYGSDALGGVMLFNTREILPSLGKETRLGANAATRYATTNNERTVTGTAEIGFRRVALLITSTYSEFGDLRSGARRSDAYPDFGVRPEYVVREGEEDVIRVNDNDRVQTPTGYSQANTLFKLRYWASANWNVNYSLLYTTSSNIPRYDRLTQYRNGNLRYAEWYYGPQDWLLNRLSILHTSDHQFFDHLNAILAVQNVEESRHDRSFGNNRLNSRTEQVDVYSLNLDFDKELKDAVLYYGAEAVYNDVTSTAEGRNIVTGEKSVISTRYPDGGSTVTSLAAYIGGRKPVAEHLTVTVGARTTFNMLNSKFVNKDFFAFPFDELEVNSSAQTYSGGAVWSPNQWTLRGTLSSGFRAPNVDDAAKVFDSEPGLVVVPNPDLKSELSYNAELGIERRLGASRVGGNAYFSILQDAMVRRDFQFNGQDSILYDGTMSRVQAIVNAGEGYITGFDLFGEIKLTQQWSARTSLTYTSGRDTEDDVPLRHIPPLFGQTSLMYEAANWNAELWSRYNNWKQLHDLAPDDDAYTDDGIPSWWTLNLRGSVRPVTHLEVTAGLENIFDLHYRPYGSGVSAPGRNLIVSLRAAL